MHSQKTVYFFSWFYLFFLFALLNGIMIKVLCNSKSNVPTAFYSPLWLAGGCIILFPVVGWITSLVLFAPFFWPSVMLFLLLDDLVVVPVHVPYLMVDWAIIYFILSEQPNCVFDSHSWKYGQTFLSGCSRRSRRGLVQEDKRMAFVYTHGLFIT